MLELSKTLANSPLWRTTLASFVDDSYHHERERLRSSFSRFRERAGLLAIEISKDLPDLTIHDITHLDSLWEVASQVCGEEFALTPTEGYVLGGAILLHDLAMSVAATPGGLSALKKDTRWRDVIFAAYRDNKKGEPSEQDFESPPEDIRKLAIFSLLRQHHAENAEKLAFLSFGSGVSSQFLIEETDLRHTFGRVIGQIAHSHWWSLAEVERVFDRQIGAPHWAPPSWTIDPLKIACILRASDAAHIDARRAPSFQKAFSIIHPLSRVHWNFQERINKAYLSEDALVFTSGQAFPLQDANAWWLCLDTLRMIDRELRGIDSLLADRSMSRFKARRVAGVDLPERMATFIQTSDWHPINATVHISDLPQIIRSLGGEELYGNRPRVPLRELIQNGSDAVRARRYYEQRTEDFGEIQVSLTEVEGQHYLRVEDNGVGMSERVLTEFLLDFGSSFWSKPQVQEEFPGLASSGFVSTGKYGIGFFSVFMAADKVTIFTRRPDAAASDTLVLEFGSGLYGRPILRPAQQKEQLRDGGTVVQLLLRKSPGEKGGLLYVRDDKPPKTLLEVCSEIAPALDATVSVFLDGKKHICSLPNDWVTISGSQFLDRLQYENNYKKYTRKDFLEWATKVEGNLRVIKNSAGIPIARICITASNHEFKRPPVNGALTVGGFTTSPLQGISGIILGEATQAARDRAEPLISDEQLAEWANSQVALILNIFDNPEELSEAAQIVRLCGGETQMLPIAIYRGEWVSAEKISTMTIPKVVKIIDDFTSDYELKHAAGLELDDNVFITNTSTLPIIFQPSFSGTTYGGGSALTKKNMPRELMGAVVEAIAASWGEALEDVRDNNDLRKETEVRVGVANSGEIMVDALIVRSTQA